MIKMLWGVVDFSPVPRVQLKEVNRGTICSPEHSRFSLVVNIRNIILLGRELHSLSNNILIFMKTDVVKLNKGKIEK